MRRPKLPNAVMLGPANGSGQLCHPEQASFAQRGIWASRAKRRVLCDAIIARLARFPIEQPYLGGNFVPKVTSTLSFCIHRSARGGPGATSMRLAILK